MCLPIGVFATNPTRVGGNRKGRMFKLFKTSQEPEHARWARTWSAAGVLLTKDAAQGDHYVENSLIGGFLTQLVDDGHALDTQDGILLGWDSLYEAMQQRAYAALAGLLALPDLTNARPTLCSSNSFTDEGFSIAIAGWVDDTGAAFNWIQLGPLLTRDERLELM